MCRGFMYILLAERVRFFDFRIDFPIGEFS